MSDVQIIEVPGHGRVEFPASMSDAEIAAAIQGDLMQRPATMNPNIAAQGVKARANMTPPTSVMDPRYPAWSKAQNDADAALAVGGLAMPLAGAVAAPGANLMASMGRNVMQRAMKPLQADLLSGKAQRGAETMLQRGINNTPGGMDKLRGLAEARNAQAADMVASSTAPVDANAVMGRLSGARDRFMQQVAPQADLAAIDDVGNAFQSHPLIQGPSMPVQLAQQLKTGTYRQLKDKYGEMGSASTEAQKALARGLKEEIETAVPGVASVNAEASELWNALNVAERRALIAQNNNLAGLSLLARSPAYTSMFLLDRSPLAQSLLARGLYNSQRVPGAVMGGAIGGAMNANPDQQRLIDALRKDQ